MLALGGRQLREVLLPLDLRCDETAARRREPVAQSARLTNTKRDDTCFLAMALARRPRLLALCPHSLLGRPHLVGDALVLVGDAVEVVEQVECIGEARRRQQKRERVGLLLPVKAIDAVSQAAQRDRVLSPQQLQTFRLEPEELVQPAQPLAAKLELALQRLELE